MTTIQYEVLISGEIPREFPSFEEAFKHLFRQVGRRIEEYSIAMTDVKTKCSLIDPQGKTYDYLSAVEEATRQGIFRNGRLVERVTSSVKPVSEVT